MPQWSDDIYLGTAPTGIAGPDSVGNPGGTGIGPMGRVYVYDIVPATLLTNGVALSQNPGSGGSFVLMAGAGTTLGTDPSGAPIVILDVPRVVTITAAGANTAVYRVTGYDYLGQLMTWLPVAPSTSTVTSTKAFKSILSATNTNATAGTNGLTVGFADVFGLPVRVSAIPYIQSVKWDTALADNAGTAVAADATSPATALTGDVRGTYAPNTAANGARRLVMSIAVPAIGCGPNATRLGALGVTQA